MTAHTSPRKLTRGRYAGRVLTVAFRFVGRVVRGVLAGIVLVALVAGLPWALVRFVGWPLPDHIPTRDEIEATLLNPMSAQFLLDALACLCWVVWFFFAVDVARCAVDAAQGFAWPEFRPTGPLRGVAAALIGTVVLTVLGNRTPTAPPTTAAVLSSDLTPIAVTAPLHPSPAQPSTDTPQQATMTLDWAAPAPPGKVVATEEVRLPHPEGGTVVYDSLWRVAERMFGDGNRWPELFAQNRGVVQFDGRALTQPHLVRPGWKITGYIPAPAPPAVQLPVEQQPPVSPSQPSKTASPTPAATPPLARSATQAPASGSNTGAHTGEQDSARQPGLDLLTGVFVSLLLAGVISAAAVSVRIWRRRRYRIGSGDRSDLRRPIAPVVRALRAAHDSDDGTANLDDLDVVEATPPSPVRIHITDAGKIEPDDQPIGVPARVGVRGGRELALNLASTRGLGLLGSGATAAARALLLHLLAQHIQDGADVRVLLPAPDLPLIFDSADVARLPSAVSVVDSLDVALDEMETELVTRTRHRIDETTPRPRSGTLVLVGSPSAHAERRLQAVMDNGSTLGMAGVLLGQWRPGATVRVRPDGMVSATSPGLGDSLSGTRLFTLPAADTTELLAVLREAEGPADHAPKPGEDRGKPSSALGDAPTDVAVDEPHPSDENDTFDELTRLELTERPDDTGRTEAEPAPRLRVLEVQPAPVEIPPSSAPPTRMAGAGSNDVHTMGDSQDRVNAVSYGSPIEERQEDVRVSEPSVTPPLALRVLGRVELALREDGAGRELTGALTRKQREVLVYLALHPDGARRDAINDAVWPDSPISRPFNSFHNALSTLRRALHQSTEGRIGEIVIHDDGRYQLDSRFVTTDYGRFAAALGARGSAGDAARIDALHQAVAVYTGHLAEDLSSYWIEGYREATRRDVLDALGILIRAYSESKPDATLALLEKLRTLDPYNEGVYRDIIRTQARLRQDDAIGRTLALLVSTLDELGQHPSQNTVNLAKFLQRQGIAGSSPAAGGAAAS